jgi:hypothetical protein
MILTPVLDRLDTLFTNWLISAAGLSGLPIEPNVAEFGAVIAELMVVANIGLFKD